MRIIIACAGPQTKWNNHLGVPSHLVPVGGEPLLHRTVRQALTLTNDVHVTSPDDDRYAIWTSLGPGDGIVHGVVRHIRGTEEPNEYVSTRDLWNPDGRTVLLLGDVYFTDGAMRTIGTWGRRAYRVFGRRSASRITGTPWGEIFAVSWWPEHHTVLDEHLTEIGDANKAGWRLLRLMQGTPVDRHIVRGKWFTTIDDMTDDIDFAADYERHPMMGGACG